MSQLCFTMATPFSGATLLGLLINNHSYLSSLGDAIPTRAYDQMCACGKKVSTCKFWAAIRLRLKTDRFADGTDLLPSFPLVLRNRRANNVMVRLLRGLEGHPIPLIAPHGQLESRSRAVILHCAARALSLAGDRHDAYIATQLAFYHAVCELHGARYFVDGSKSPLKAVLLANYVGKNVRVKVIHLTRDPRGFYVSYRNNVRRGDPTTIGRSWSSQHSTIAALPLISSNIDIHRVRYEDLCTDPGRIMNGVFDFLEVPREDVVGAPRYCNKHHLMGNKMLFAFDGTIRADTAWCAMLTQQEQRAVLMGAGPAALKYGYQQIAS